VWDVPFWHVSLDWSLELAEEASCPISNSLRWNKFGCAHADANSLGATKFNDGASIAQI
jgi:hypothetical protein